MKVIDLLNKIANGEEVPKHVRYYNMIENIDDIMYVCKENIFCKLDTLQIHLNSRVEIIEEEKKTKPLTKKDIEALGYACGEIQKCFTNGWTKSLETKPLEEEHKIPEKIEICYSPDIEEEIFYEKGNKPNHYVLGDVGTKLIINKINEILDYLKEIK